MMDMKQNFEGKTRRRKSFSRYRNCILGVFTSGAIGSLFFPASAKLVLTICFLTIPLCFFYKHVYRLQRCMLGCKSEGFFSFVIALTTVAGIYFERGLPFEEMSAAQFLQFGVQSAGMLPLTFGMIRLLCSCLNKWMENERRMTTPHKLQFKVWLAGFFFILLCWSVVWLAYYPGLWNYDPWEVDQLLQNDYTKHHPLIHTLFLGNCYLYGLEIGNPAVGLMLYEGIQCIILAAVFAFTVAFIKANSKGKIFPVVVLLFFALFPVNSLMALSTTKDVLFAGFILLAVLLAVLCIREKRTIYKRILMVCETALFALIMLLRNNAVYCFFACFLFSLVQIRNSLWRKALVLFVLGIFIASFTDAALGYRLNAKRVHIREMLSMPSQQLGRIYTEIKEKGMEDEESAKLIEQYYDMEKAEYKPYLADPMKGNTKIYWRSQLPELAKASMTLFAKYPLISIDSLLYTTQGLWYLFDTSNAKVYDGYGERYGLLMTDIKDGYGIASDSRFPALEALYERLFTDNEYANIPVLSILFSPAAYIYFSLVTMVCVFRRKSVFFICFPFFVFLLGTVALGPCILIRYVYPWITCFPMFLWLSVHYDG